MPATTSRFTLARLAVCLLIVSCGDSTGVTPAPIPKPGPPATIHMVSQPGTFTLVAGTDPEPMIVVVRDAAGLPVPGAFVEFERSRLHFGQTTIDQLEITRLGSRLTDAEGKATFQTLLPVQAAMYQTRATISGGSAASAFYLVGPAEMVAFGVAPDTITVSGSQRSVYLEACGRDRFGNCIVRQVGFRSLSDEILDVDPPQGRPYVNGVWVHGIQAGDAAVVATLGAFADTAFIRVR